MPSKGKSNKAAKSSKTNGKSSKSSKTNYASNKAPVIYISCDLVESDLGISPIFVAIVDVQGGVPLSSYVIPYGTVIDWKTEITSLSCFDDLADCNPITMDNLFEYLEYLILPESIIIGYGLEIVLEALRLTPGVDFSAAVDVSAWFGLRLSSPSLIQYFTLSHVVKTVLNEDILDIFSGQHDPLTDAKYIRLLYEKFVKLSYEHPTLQKIRRSLYQSLPAEQRIPDPALMITVQQIPLGYGNKELETLLPAQVRHSIECIQLIEWALDSASTLMPSSFEPHPPQYCYGEIFGEDSSANLCDDTCVEIPEICLETLTEITTAKSTPLLGVTDNPAMEIELTHLGRITDGQQLSSDCLNDINPSTPVSQPVSPAQNILSNSSHTVPQEECFADSEVLTTVPAVAEHKTICWADDDPSVNHLLPTSLSSIYLSNDCTETETTPSYGPNDIHPNSTISQSEEAEKENVGDNENYCTPSPMFSGHAVLHCQTVQDLRKIILRLHSNPEEWDWQVRKEGSLYVSRSTGVVLKEVDNPGLLIYVHSVPEDWTELEVKKKLIPEQLVAHVKEVKQTQYRRNKLGVQLGRTHIQFDEDWCVWQMMQILHHQHQSKGPHSDWNFTTLKNGNVVFTYAPNNVIIEPVCTITWQQLLYL